MKERDAADRRSRPARRSLALIVMTAIAGAAPAIGCARAPGLKGLAASDHELFAACAPALTASLCGEGDDAAKARCLEAREAAYGRLHSAHMRRRWLLSNGCSESTLDAPPTAIAVATVPGVSLSPTSAATAEATHAESPPAEAASPTEPAPPEPAPPAAEAAPASAEPPPAQPPEPLPPAAAPAVAAVSDAPASPAPEGTRRDEAPPVSAPSASPNTSTKTAGEQRLRDIILAHSAEMKSCVERQLKLIPDLRAEGTLMLEVDAAGAVARAELLGTDLAGTPLESCLQTVSARWRFPASKRPYRIDAPVKVSGAPLAR